ncbi:phage major tail tube protein [Trabulsiella guamensis ATCC 49490]|uniref:Phage major tail tube protein n=1 Tax=Trabulsiella guamensis ATCC 49490 TaxID=1005994 RepID=A0A085AFM9_9ENTR|nr:phage major tail tube protein [Trabulsiella guamensis]KFC09024.1 phage major tail tube protein [Trabulsiella guamensis ATCC 49490]
MAGVLTRMAQRAVIQGVPLYLTLEDVADPAPKKMMEKTRGGSFVEREVSTGIEAMTASLTIKGCRQEVLAMYGLQAGKNCAVTVDEGYRDEDGTQFKVKSEWVGEISSIEDSNTKMGELSQTVINFSCRRKKKTINGRICWEVASDGSVVNLGQEDFLAPFRAIVGLA